MGYERIIRQDDLYLGQLWAGQTWKKVTRQYYYSTLYIYQGNSSELKGTFRYVLFVSKHQKINLTCMLGMGTSLARASMNEYNKSLA